MGDFLLPYHFYPVPETAGRENDLRKVDFPDKAKANITHDRYVEGMHSGRLICRLKTVTPVVMGGEQQATQPREVENYRIGGRAAFPASSLRGLISSIAEAASNSTMRVMDAGRMLSFRRSMEDNLPKLSALGQVFVKPGENGNKTQYFLRPMVIPTLRVERGIAKLPEQWRKAFPRPVMKVYLGDARSIRDERIAPRNSQPRQWYAMNLKPRSWGPDYELEDDDLQHRKPAATRQYVLSQLPDGQGGPVVYDPNRHLAEEGWVPGVIRSLGCWPSHRLESIPRTKKHELFLPVAVERTWPVLPIPDEVVETFHTLAAERTEASKARYHRDRQKTNPLLPFEPFGSRPERYNEGQELITLKSGDIVYFDVDSRGCVSEISFSAVWRGRVPGKLKDFFPSAVLPLDEKKETITMAELLFGFVETKEEKATGSEARDEKTAVKALASRVKFGSAQAKEDVRVQLLPRTILKIQDAPKLPSPAFYFTNRTGPAGLIAKSSLKPSQHRAMGRKVYLHHPWEKGMEPWKTLHPQDNLEQKARVQPIDAGQEFYFHLDFDNLSEEELGLLLYALAPTDEFHHKIGMGKALGLGSVKVEVLGAFEVDRQARYSTNNLSGPRYTKVVPWAEGGVKANGWPRRYEREASSAMEAIQAGDQMETTLSSRRDEYRNQVDASIRRAIELLGDPAKVVGKVSQPLVVGQVDAEMETFLWNVANDRGNGGQFLQPIQANDRELRRLRRLPRYEGGGR